MISMSDKIFVDSNIFIYVLDHNDEDKRQKAKNLLIEASETARIILSTQVINEIYAVASKKLNINPVQVKRFISSLYDFDVIIVTREIIDAAIDCSILQQINYWDALMLSAAAAGHCSVIWTEDLNNHQIINGVRVVNPFVV